MAIGSLPDATSALTTIAVLFFSLLAAMAMRFSIPGFGKPWNVQGKNVFITGGSQGLGLGLAKIIAGRGANVVICARSTDKLKSAVEEIQSSSVTSTQKIAFVNADISDFENAKNAISKACDIFGSAPDAVFCCAGAATPGFFLEQGQTVFEAGFRTIYMTALATAHAAMSVFVREKKAGAKIILVGSTLSLMGMVGYTQYAPMKYAIRGLAECLRAEGLLYGVNVHAYFPGTIASPGYEQENKTKPEITKQIEGQGVVQSPESCAKRLLSGVEKGQFFITSDFDTELIRIATASGGTCPGNNMILDRLKHLIALPALTVWRIFISDAAVRKNAEAHRTQLNLASKDASQG